MTDITSFHPPKTSPSLGREGSEERRKPGWTFDAVQDRLVEAFGCLRRLPSGRASPFAKDGPWSQVVRDRADVAEQLLAGHEVATPARVPLDTAEVGRMDEALGWVRFVRAEDARMLGIVLAAIERQGGSVGWTDLSRRVGIRTRTGRLLGPEALKMRYRRAVQRIALALETPVIREVSKN